MNQYPELIQAIIEGIQEKKGRDIAVIDLSQIITAPAAYFVIATCNAPQQVDAVTDSVEEFARKQAGEKCAAIAGRENSEWVAMDYGTAMVHLFLAETREHYDLEHLWDDAPIERIPDLD